VRVGKLSGIGLQLANRTYPRNSWSGCAAVYWGWSWKLDDINDRPCSTGIRAGERDSHGATATGASNRSVMDKHSQRVLLDSNWFDTAFAEGQDEFIIVNCFVNPYQVCQDFTVTNNLFAYGPMVAAIAGYGNNQTGQRILFRNNLAIDISGVNWGGFGVAFQVNESNAVTADHNAIVNRPPLYLNGLNFSDPAPSTGTNFRYTNNMRSSPFANGMNPGQAIAALPSSTFGTTVFVGDIWAYPNQNDIANTPTYPAKISSLSARLHFLHFQHEGYRVVLAARLGHGRLRGLRRRECGNGPGRARTEHLQPAT